MEWSLALQNLPLIGKAFHRQYLFHVFPLISLERERDQILLNNIYKNLIVKRFQIHAVGQPLARMMKSMIHPPILFKPKYFTTGPIKHMTDDLYELSLSSPITTMMPPLHLSRSPSSIRTDAMSLHRRTYMNCILYI